jgi:hypothetical protein
MKNNPTAPVLVSIPAHLFNDVEKALSKSGYHLTGDRNNYKLTAIPYLIQKMLQIDVYESMILFGQMG